MNSTIKIAGHRGYKDKAVENSKQAFLKAIEEKLDYIEFDVRKTLDNIPVIFHDENLSRMLKGNKGKIQEFALDQLKKFNYEDGQKILTLEDLFSMTHGKIGYILDLKVMGIESKILELVRKYKIENQIILQSKYKKVIIRFHSLAPDLSYALYRGFMGKLGKFGKVLRFNQILALIYYYKDIKSCPIE
ncbi:MAG: hypothetical protein EU542_07190, partial [Promethearchaeota archaeon]